MIPIGVPMILIEKKKFIIELEEDIHKDIKRRCVERNITMRKWVLIAIIERIKREEGFEAITECSTSKD